MSAIHPASSSFDGARVNQAWTANDGREVAAVYFGDGGAWVAVDDVQAALSVADAFQEAARQVRLRELAAQRRAAVAS